VAGYVNQDSTGWTELRVHGVSGATPENLLDHPHAARVDGNGEAGFFRRWWEAPPKDNDTSEERLEAYSWGGLTAGSGQRALWLLLTPFMLVNVAFWALPYGGHGEAGVHKHLRRTAEAIQRLFALSITLTMLLGFVTASMNFVGWQCADPTDTCAAKYSWLRFLSWSWIDLPGRRLVVTALLPLLVIGLLWWLAHKSWRQTEATTVPYAAATDQETPLENRRVWNGSDPVRRLRAVHIAASFAFVTVFMLAPFAGTQARTSGRGPALLLLVALALLTATVVLACLPSMSDRAVPAGGAPADQAPGAKPPETRRQARRRRRVDAYALLPWIGLGLVVGAGVVAWLQTARTADLVSEQGRTSLPALSAVVDVLVVTQLVSWLGMLALLLVMRGFAAPLDEPGSPSVAGATVVTTRPAWHGLVTVGLMMLGSALAAAFAAGLALWVAHVIGRPAPRPVAADAFVVPMAYFWAAALSALAMVVAVISAAVTILWLKTGVPRVLTESVIDSYPEAGIKAALAVTDGAPARVATRDRARHIARQWRQARITEAALWMLGLFTAVLAALIGASVVGFIMDQDWVYRDVRWAVNIGDLVVAGFVLATLYVGRQAYSNPKLRRTVGVLWDVGTFWPRATHPLAPPCYTERAVPDLVTRIGRLSRGGGRILLSCHSQGTVLGAAALMQLTYNESAHVALLTYGSPLRRLYTRVFPAYFGVRALQRAGAFLVGVPVDITDPARSRWPWRNLYRRSDPIGGPILINFPAVETSKAQRPTHPEVGDNHDVDRQLVDPVFAWTDGRTGYPPTHGHSGYSSDPAYRECVQTLRSLR
jgi:hypothetical protein